MLIGAHMSIAGGIYNSLYDAQKIGFNAVQIFVKNSRTWKAKPYDEDDVGQWFEAKKETGIKSIVAHSIYLVNLASDKSDTHSKSMEDMRIEMGKCDQLNIPYLVLHPGTNPDREHGLALIAKSLDKLYEDGFKVSIALEGAAGQGNNLGTTFEELAQIADQMKYKDKITFCLDTCHSFSAGYEFRTEEGYNHTISEFDRIIGLERLSILHINDSKYSLGSRKDRHEHIGKGMLGLEPFRFILNDKRLENIPKILETPKGEDFQFDKMNLKTLKELVNR